MDHNDYKLQVKKFGSIKLNSKIPKNRKFEFLEDIATADIAFECYGRNLSELFENAAYAIFDIMVDLKSVKSKISKNIKLKAETVENLLYDFLSEIIYIKDADYMVFNKVLVKIKEGRNDYQLEAVIYGDKIDYEEQKLKLDVKAVTMHMFMIQKLKTGYKALVIVDI